MSSGENEGNIIQNENVEKTEYETITPKNAEIESNSPENEKKKNVEEEAIKSKNKPENSKKKKKKNRKRKKNKRKKKVIEHENETVHQNDHSHLIQPKPVSKGFENVAFSENSKTKEEEETEKLIQTVMKKQSRNRPIFKRKYGDNKALKILMIIYIFCPLILQVVLRGWVIFLFVLSKHTNFFHWFFFFCFCFVIIMSVVFSVVCLLIEEARKLFVSLSTFFSVLFSLCSLGEIAVCFSLRLPPSEEPFIAVTVVAAIISLSGFFVPASYCISIFKRSFAKKRRKNKSLFFGE